MLQEINYGDYKLALNVKNIVVLTSGGVDSATTLLQLANDGHTLFPFNIHYEKRRGQMEYGSLKNVVNWLKKNFGAQIKDIKKIELTDLWNLHIENSSSREDEFIPFRNLIFASFGALYGFKNGIRDIALGLVAQGNYPDCTENFKKKLENVLIESVRHEIKVHAPFINKQKADVIKYGAQSDFPYELTYSCYRGENIHCGQCAACRVRQNAFKLADIKDPTKYEIPMVF